MDYVRFNVLKNEEGQGLVEYALIIVLISVALVTLMGTLAGEDGRGGIGGAFQAIIDELAP